MFYSHEGLILWIVALIGSCHDRRTLGDGDISGRGLGSWGFCCHRRDGPFIFQSTLLYLLMYTEQLKFLCEFPCESKNEKPICDSHSRPHCPLVSLCCCCPSVPWPFAIIGSLQKSAPSSPPLADASAPACLGWA